MCEKLFNTHRQTITIHTQIRPFSNLLFRYYSRYRTCHLHDDGFIVWSPLSFAFFCCCSRCLLLLLLLFIAVLYIYIYIWLCNSMAIVLLSAHLLFYRCSLHVIESQSSTPNLMLLLLLPVYVTFAFYFSTGRLLFECTRCEINKPKI